jgi:RHS repeat-associated protein
MNHVSGVAMTRGSTTQTRTFVYNDTGTLASATNPENGTVNYTYNSFNQLTTKIDAKGQETDYTYDGKNRLILTMQYPYGKSNYAAGCSYVAYAWDGALPGNSTFTSQYNTGRLTTVDYGTVGSYYNGTYSPCAQANNPSYFLGLGYIEMYSYHPAGGIIDKELQVNPLYPGTDFAIGTPATLDVYYTFNQAGQIATIAYPTTGSQYNQTTNTYTPNTFTYAYDTMGRPNSLQVDYGWATPCYPTGYKWVQNVTYDYAGRQSGLQYWDGNCDTQYMTESKTWNGSGQLAGVGWSGTSSYPTSGVMLYGYSATQNNGQITQAVDTFSGETIVYQYDLLKRLVSASATPTSGSTSAPWTETFQYDGFGNLTAKVLDGTSTPIPVNAATNQLTNAYYDCQRQHDIGGGSEFHYDASNRIASETGVSGGYYTNEYAPDNKRIHQTPSSGTDEWIFYGANGEKLGVYSIGQWYDNNGNAHSVFSPMRTSVWFGGKLIYENGLVYLDRLGTNHAQSAQFLPYGDEITSTSNDRTKFATYTRDSYTGLDYADQRFYASTYGRFMTPDPYVAGGAKKGSVSNPKDPGSWNRYAYTRGDPVNRFDPNGTCDITTYSTSTDGTIVVDCTDIGDSGDDGSGDDGSGDDDGIGDTSVPYSCAPATCAPSPSYQQVFQECSNYAQSQANTKINTAVNIWGTVKTSLEVGGAIASVLTVSNAWATVIQDAATLTQVTNLTTTAAYYASALKNATPPTLWSLVNPILDQVLDLIQDQVVADATTYFNSQAAALALQCAGAPGN